MGNRIIEEEKPAQRRAKRKMRENPQGFNLKSHGLKPGGMAATKTRCVI